EIVEGLIEQPLLLAGEVALRFVLEDRQEVDVLPRELEAALFRALWAIPEVDVGRPHDREDEDREVDLRELVAPLPLFPRLIHADPIGSGESSSSPSPSAGCSMGIVSACASRSGSSARWRSSVLGSSRPLARLRSRMRRSRSKLVS